MPEPEIGLAAAAEQRAASRKRAKSDVKRPRTTGSDRVSEPAPMMPLAGSQAPTCTDRRQHVMAATLTFTIRAYVSLMRNCQTLVTAWGPGGLRRWRTAGKKHIMRVMPLGFFRLIGRGAAMATCSRTTRGAASGQIARDTIVWGNTSTGVRRDSPKGCYCRLDYMSNVIQAHLCYSLNPFFFSSVDGGRRPRSSTSRRLLKLTSHLA
ncbi:hypothetical protein B0H67DRAFT_145192 [Lasiosphaeris hirsuta]|uniref:Uncharacterized protein n=1 Tax=Lasiosphaeris hirsuta TaxID=260670 RepID=A0AA40E6P0_9PEZI|nr:hypothetical protein B0H67DRAFT_145192 [Lasiosphaeris hirsuta]